MFKGLREPKTFISTSPLSKGRWQFAVCAVDKAGNYSSPFQASSWKNVIIDFVPPADLIGGKLKRV